MRLAPYILIAALTGCNAPVNSPQASPKVDFAADVASLHITARNLSNRIDAQVGEIAGLKASIGELNGVKVELTAELQARDVKIAGLEKTVEDNKQQIGTLRNQSSGNWNWVFQNVNLQGGAVAVVLIVGVAALVYFGKRWGHASERKRKT